MTANVQDVFMLFGDSITQGAWEPGLNGFGQRLSRKPDFPSNAHPLTADLHAQMSTHES